MNRYARIQDGLVAEVFETEHDVSTLFHPALVWVRVPEGQSVGDGWAYESGSFSQRTVAPPAPEPTLAELQAQLQILTARISVLGQHS